MTIRSPRFGALLIVSLLVALLIGLFLSHQQQNMAFGLWPRFEMDEVASMDITLRGEGFTLAREQGGWVVRGQGDGPDVPPAPADRARIEALLAAIAHNRPTQNLGPQNPAEASSYGFESPAVRILIRSSSKDLHDVQILLGKETPAGAAIHAQCSLQPDTVFLLDASVLHQLDKPAEHYHDLRLLDLRAEEAQRLSFTSGNGLAWELERRDDSYVFNAPDSLRGSSVSASEVRLYLHNLSALAADTLLTRPDRQPPGKPQFSIAIQPARDQAAMQLELYAPAEGAPVFGRSSWHPVGFLLDREKARALYRQTYDMQWRGVVGFDAALVERVRVFAPGGNQTLGADKTAKGWEDRDHGRALPGIDITLWRLKELRIESEPVTRLVPPVELRLTCELFARDDKSLALFSFYVDPRLPPGQCWLKVGHEELFYPVGSQIIDDLQGHLPPRAARPAAPPQGPEAAPRKP